MLTFEASIIEEYKVINEIGDELATLKLMCGEWFMWELNKGKCLQQKHVKQISKKLKELNNAEI